jgi:hypothetical protein
VSTSSRWATTCSPSLSLVAYSCRSSVAFALRAHDDRSGLPFSSAAPRASRVTITWPERRASFGPASASLCRRGRHPQPAAARADASLRAARRSKPSDRHEHDPHLDRLALSRPHVALAAHPFRCLQLARCSAWPVPPVARADAATPPSQPGHHQLHGLPVVASSQPGPCRQVHSRPQLRPTRLFHSLSPSSHARYDGSPRSRRRPRAGRSRLSRPTLP